LQAEPLRSRLIARLYRRSVAFQWSLSQHLGVDAWMTIKAFKLFFGFDKSGDSVVITS